MIAARGGPELGLGFRSGTRLFVAYAARQTIWTHYQLVTQLNGWNRVRGRASLYSVVLSLYVIPNLYVARCIRHGFTRCAYNSLAWTSQQLQNNQVCCEPDEIPGNALTLPSGFLSRPMER